ncbi:hypothetical protein [Rubellicoccus peritrichatus]|uniref:PEP-CTERM protein-sorting domain-containing protein n=1 Tax=Rubellicoccus peritrichatus TaxID=3080537 RepID=A0AAQ3LBE8_9BACT|nr:hypothetical protein [Puniceicoccus sp. CR14]WOO42192.1 hypothetical protein RZN69_03760 [Puniceicoccus sp. CR14]
MRVASLATLFVGINQANGAIQYFNTEITLGTGESVPPLWDVDGNSTGPMPDYEASIYRSGSSSAAGFKGIGNSMAFRASVNKLLGLTTSAYVSAGNTFRNYIIAFESTGASSSDWYFDDVTGPFPGGTGYIGFTFNPSGVDLFGWAHITMVTGTVPLPIVTIHEWAYQDNGDSIQVGAIPEPSGNALIGLGVLVLGAVGLRRWRKHKASRNEKQAS